LNIRSKNLATDWSSLFKSLLQNKSLSIMASSTKFVFTKLHRVIFQVVNFQQIFGVLPISYNPQTGLFYRTSSKLRRNLFATLVYLEGIDLCYLFATCQTITPATVNENDFVNYYMHTVSRCTGWMIAKFLLLCPDDCLYLFNVLLHMDDKLLGKILFY